MSELKNEQAYKNYHECKLQTAKDYWLNFLISRANRGIEEARLYVDKIKACNDNK